MTYLKKRVASHKILRFLQKNKVIFFFQKKSVQSDHWRLLKKKIAKIEGVASLNLKNKRDKKEIQPLILSYLTSQGNVTTLSNSAKRMVPTTLKMGPSSPTEVVKSSVSGNEKISNVFQERPWQTHHAPLLESKMHQRDSIRVEPHPGDQDRLKMVERICGLLYAPNLILGSDSLKKLAHLSNQLREDSNLIFTGGWDGNQLINHLDSSKLLETPQDIWKDGVSCLSSCYARPYLFLHSLLEKRKNDLVCSLKEKMYALVRSLEERKAQQAKEQEKD